MSHRIKAVTEIRSRDEFERVIDQTVELQLTKEQLELCRDQTLLEVREKFEGEINQIAERMQVNVIRAEKFANEHRDELLPGKKKSADTKFAFFGFRTSNPTLVLLNRKWTWQKVVDFLKEQVEWRKFLVIKASVDKDAMKAQLTPGQLAICGTRIEQKEVFFVDPKRDPADPKRLVAPGVEAAVPAAA